MCQPFHTNLLEYSKLNANVVSPFVQSVDYDLVKACMDKFIYTIRQLFMLRLLPFPKCIAGVRACSTRKKCILLFSNPYIWYTTTKYDSPLERYQLWKA